MDARGGADAAEEVKTGAVTAPEVVVEEGGGAGAGETAAGVGSLVAGLADLVEEKKVGVALVVGVADLCEEKKGEVECVAAVADLEEKKSGVEEKQAVVALVAAVPDVVVKQALVDVQDVEPLQPAVEKVAESSVVSGSNKRKLEDYTDPYEDVISDPSSLEYDSQDSRDTVDSRNVASFTRKVVNKIQDEGISAYLVRGRYVCPWHTNKPRGGLRENLVQHVRAVALSGASARERTNHVALLKVLEPDDEPKE